MNGYYLTQNLMYNCKHVKVKRWWHKLFGEPRLTLDFCKAENETEATAKFINRGYHMGIFHEADILICKHKGYEINGVSNEIRN